uniref:CHAT domain-containing protein n=1 Tax=Amphimedon queenslandica TaxID=400682 RepID=A0A1X7TDU7_AMPQE
MQVKIESLRLQSCLIILSSCDSGRGKFKGDEIQGMCRSFLLAGAAAVMTSLWKVPDQSASYFMHVSLQKSIQSIRSIHHFSQVIHWGGYQLTGSDARIVVEVSDQDKMVFKALGCPEGVSPFPCLELLQQLENNLLSSSENNVQIYGPCGTNPAETIKDFIAKHHSAYINLSTSVVCDYGDHQSSMLLVVDSATVDNVADLIPLSRHKNIQIILVAQWTPDCKEMAREVDIKLKMGVSSLQLLSYSWQ